MAPPQTTSHAGRRSTDGNLLEALKTWRNSVARAKACPAYVVMKNESLEQLSIIRPSSLDELRYIDGLGPIKIKEHGQALLNLIWQRFYAPSQLLPSSSSSSSSSTAAAIRNATVLLPLPDTPRRITSVGCC
mmetsp:Transcript_61719/g.121200  ORF Transcript_61719/g.121200 Transcript_61719/m.121200 type:complete len:132 (+) Transcript_61719:153-548(+)